MLSGEDRGNGVEMLDGGCEENIAVAALFVDGRVLIPLFKLGIGTSRVLDVVERATSKYLIFVPRKSVWSFTEQAKAENELLSLML
jgi:hypothetical protein